MKKQVNIPWLPCLILVLGLTAAGVRKVIYGAAVDGRGLLIPWNLPSMVLLALAAAAIALVVTGVRNQGNGNRYGDNFPPSVFGCVSCLLLALSIALELLRQEVQLLDRVALMSIALSWLSLPCLVVTGYGRLKGRRPVWVYNGILCLSFALDLADRYRAWSGNPQLQDYWCQMLACVGLTLTAYHLTAFDVGLGHRKHQQAIALLTAFFCLAGGFDSGVNGFYLATAVWCLASVAKLRPEDSVEVAK